MGRDEERGRELRAAKSALRRQSVLAISKAGLASASIATRTKMATMAAENLLAGVRGEALPNCVNPEVKH